MNLSEKRQIQMCFFDMPTWTALLMTGIWAGLVWGLIPGCNSSERIAESAYQEGLSYKESDQFPQAMQQFRLALAQNPQHEQAYLELGILLCHTGRYRQAIKHLLRAREYGEMSYKLSAFMGFAYEQLGMLRLSEKAYKLALTQAPNLIDVRLRLADVLETQAKRREAAEILHEVLAIEPEIEQSELIRLRSSLLQQPESPDVHYALADLYIRHGQITKGITEYQRVKPLEPENPDALIDFGLFCLEREQFLAAATYLQRAKQLGRPEQLEVRAGLGVAYEELGQIQEAIQEYRIALDLQPDWYEIHLKLAELFEQVERFDEAADELEHLFYVSQRTPELKLGEGVFDINSLWSEILRLRGEQSSKAIVQLKRSGQYTLIDVVLNQQIPATLLVEENAEYTIISEELAQKLGIHITSRTSEYQFVYAGRRYSAPLVNLPSLRIGELEARNIPTLVWNLSGYPGIDGFLGMTFLKHFQLEINYDDQLVVLTKLYS